MNNISFYLEKYSNYGLKEDQIKKTLVETVKKICNVEIDKEEIRIGDKTFSLNIQGPRKTEIFINLEKIQTEFKKRVENLGYKLSQKRVI